MESARNLMELYMREINTHDFNSIISLISQDCKCWFSSGTYSGPLEIRRAFEKTWSMIKSEVYTIQDIDWIGESDSVAVCTYTYHWNGIVNGERREGRGRGTSCFRKELEGWKIIHEHLSPFP